MKAAVVPELGAPLEVRDLSVPSPGPGQVLVKIEACGLCHTDIHAARGEWPVKPKIPLIPGHEGVGVVTELGDGDLPVVEGDRVALPWLGYACGHCRQCVSGWETYCQKPQYMGYTMDGSYAEYAVAYASHVVKVPEGVDPLDAAPLTCAGVTTYKGLTVAHPQAQRDRDGRRHRRSRSSGSSVRQGVRQHHGRSRRGGGEAPAGQGARVPTMSWTPVVTCSKPWKASAEQTSPWSRSPPLAPCRRRMRR